MTSTPERTRSLRAPWSSEQIEALRVRQADTTLHPYTCTNGCGVLTPTCDGWICETCGWKQDWCYVSVGRGSSPPCREQKGIHKRRGPG